MKRWIILVFSLTSFYCHKSISQKGIPDWEKEDRPKVGLVFSGGVAHGLAHIGVLKYLEEEGIPIDYITGTSMGAIVGGLKAMGLTAEEIASEIAKQNWAEILYNRIDLDRIAPLEKFYHNKMPIKLIVNRSGVRLPLSLVGGHNLDMVIARQYAPANYINRFDELPIPFKCIASDIGTGEKVVLDSGYLGRAIRASMSMPLVFKPVERDGRLLVDGGLVRNYPVEEIQEMGADIVIGCDVGYKLLPSNELYSSVEILYQAGFMSMHKDALIQKELTNIHFEPEVKNYSIFGFKDFGRLIDEGYQEAKRHKAEVDKLKAILNQYPLNEPARDRLILNDSLNITQIAAINGLPLYTELIRQRFNDGITVKYSADDVEARINQIYGTNNFSSIDYSYEGLSDGTIGLNLYSQIKKESSLGVNINYFGKSKTSFIVRGELRNVITPLSRLNIVGRLSNNTAFQFDFLQRFGNRKKLYFSLDGKVEREELPLFYKNSFLQEFKRDLANMQIHMGTELSFFSTLSVYYRMQNEMLKPRIFSPNYLAEYESRQHVLGWEMEYNSMDEPLYASKGWHGKVQSEFFLAGNIETLYSSELGSELYPFDEKKACIRLMVQLEGNKSLNNKLTLNHHFAGGYSNSDGFKGIFRIGGTDLSDPFGLAFIGKYESHLTLSQFIYLEQRWSYEVHDDWFIAIVANVVNGDDALEFLKQEEKQSRWNFGSGIALHYKSPLGPVVINIGVSSDGFISDFGMGHKYIF